MKMARFFKTCQNHSDIFKNKIFEMIKIMRFSRKVFFVNFRNFHLKFSLGICKNLAARYAIFTTPPSRAFDLDEEANELIVPIDDKETIKERQAQNWFSQDDWFDGLADTRALDEANLNAVFPAAKKPRLEKPEVEKPEVEKPEGEEEPETSEKMDVDNIIDDENQDDNESEEESESETDSDSDSDNDEEAQRAYLNDMENRIGRRHYTD